jgi:hypothetical protein
VVAEPSAQELALACGPADFYVDVTDDLVTDTIKGSWGRNSGFNDTRPGVFSFDLVNDTGKYTPGSASSPLGTPVRVGMGVHHIVDGMHFAGTIRSAQPYFTGPESLAGSSKVRVTCEDMLGNAGRRSLDGLLASALASNSPFYWWPLDDPAGSAVAAGGTAPALAQSGPTTFGVAGISGVSNEQARIAAGSGLGATLSGTLNYSGRNLGEWGIWITNESASNAALAVSYANFPATTGFNAFSIRTLPVGGAIIPRFAGASVVDGAPLDPGLPHWLSVTLRYHTSLGGVTTLYATPSVDGVPFSAETTIGSFTGTILYNSQVSPTQVALSATDAAASFSMLTLTPAPLAQYAATSGVTAAERLQLIAATAPELVLDVSANLSTALLGVQDSSGSTLDDLNAVVRTEQGYMWAETTGTLLLPVEEIKVRDRERPATVDAAHTFDVTEIQNAPEFATDIENMVSAATARGPVASATVTDPSLIPYVESASDSTTVLLLDPIDLIAWADDRLLRGKATDVRLPQITLDALEIDRWADVSALRPGDRVRVTGLPTQLGVTYIDGWLLGCSYTLKYPSLHGEDQMLFSFFLQPVLAATAVFDTNRFMGGTDLALSAGIDASVTSISVATVGATFTTSDLPLDIIVGGEQMTVTACTGATPQVMTVTRGVNGTTAAAHIAGAVVELATESLFAF